MDCRRKKTPQRHCEIIDVTILFSNKYNASSLFLLIMLDKEYKFKENKKLHLLVEVTKVVHHMNNAG